jgi:hypothetical protein
VAAWLVSVATCTAAFVVLALAFPSIQLAFRGDIDQNWKRVPGKVFAAGETRTRIEFDDRNQVRHVVDTAYTLQFPDFFGATSTADPVFPDTLPTGSEIGVSVSRTGAVFVPGALDNSTDNPFGVMYLIGAKLVVMALGLLAIAASLLVRLAILFLPKVERLAQLMKETKGKADRVRLLHACLTEWWNGHPTPSRLLASNLTWRLQLAGLDQDDEDVKQAIANLDELIPLLRAAESPGKLFAKGVAEVSTAQLADYRV